MGRGGRLPALHNFLANIKLFSWGGGGLHGCKRKNPRSSSRGNLPFGNLKSLLVGNLRSLLVDKIKSLANGNLESLLVGNLESLLV